MSVADKITRLQTAKTNIATAITNKGGTVASGAGFESFATAIGTIPSGGGTTTYSGTFKVSPVNWGEWRDFYISYYNGDGIWTSSNIGYWQTINITLSKPYIILSSSYIESLAQTKRLFGIWYYNFYQDESTITNAYILYNYLEDYGVDEHELNMALISGDNFVIDLHIAGDEEEEEDPEDEEEEDPDDEEETYIVVITIDNNDAFEDYSGDVSGDEFCHGEQITMYAYMNDGYKFEGWYENDVLISESPSFTYTVTGDTTITGKSSTL